MKVAWLTLAILAGLGILCCGGVFLFAWGSFRVSLKANNEAEVWANTHFPDIANHWDSATWITLDQPDKPPDSSDIKKLTEKFRTQFGDLLSVDPFVATKTYIVTSSKGLEFTITLHAKAKFAKGPGDVTFLVHHAMSVWTVQSIDVKAKTTPDAVLHFETPQGRIAFVS